MNKKENPRKTLVMIGGRDTNLSKGKKSIVDKLKAPKGKSIKAPHARVIK